MNSGQIKRIRGDALQLKWPAVQLDGLIKEASKIRTLWHGEAALGRALYETQKAAIAEFAKAQGWRPAKSDPRPERLFGKAVAQKLGADFFDHPNWFRVGSILACVVHLYGKLALEKLPKDLIVDELPESWYCPGHTRAYVLRPLKLSTNNTIHWTDSNHEK